VRFAELPAGDLEGRFGVRVVVEGASNSPLTLGTLQLDRTAPVATSIFLTPAGGPVEADWVQSDALSGTDPGAPITVEVNAGPLGDASGAWIGFREQPEPGDGRRLARTDLSGLPDGRHLVRARTRDRAGNAGDLVLGTVVSDRTPPVVTGVRVARPASAGGRIAEIGYSATDAGVGMMGAPRAQVAPPGADDGADLVVPGASGFDRLAVRLPSPGCTSSRCGCATRWETGSRGRGGWDRERRPRVPIWTRWSWAWPSCSTRACMRAGATDR
jgi:hypothetical protein